MTFDVRFVGGPLDGKFKAHPRDPGDTLVFPTENGSDVVYRRDNSEAAEVYLKDTGRHLFTVEASDA